MADRTYVLWLRKNGSVRMHDGVDIGVWPFTDSKGQASLFPGPLLVSNEGQTVEVTFKNNMNEHTFHFHGIDADTPNDGVPETYPVVDTYTFLTDHAGTYWYHCHANTVLHQQMGMYGPFVVLPADGSNRAWTGGPAFAKQYVWMLSEFDSAWRLNNPKPNFAYFNPDYFLINGKDGFDPISAEDTAIACNAGDTVLLRLIHAGYLVARISLGGLPFSVVASDGRPFPLQETPQVLEMASGERYDLLVTPAVPGTYPVRVDYLDWYTRAIRGSARTTVSVL
ncbi:MAG TPA: multicopper oxidase family protein [Thermoplasmata archaeon]|nr:multicopper oxidase family protein [Thermoplasmata archaeon]